jgi:hypothetical protein
MKKKVLSKAQQWAAERFLTKGHITNSLNHCERIILAKGTLPIESRRLTLAVNHLQEILKDFESNQAESKQQFMKLK